MTAKVVWIEGMDGTGKSVLAHALAIVALEDPRYRQDYRPGVLELRQPTTSEIGKLIRLGIRGDVVSRKALLYLFLADAVDCEERNKHEINRQSLIIFDRHARVSGSVYQVTEHDEAKVQLAYQSYQFREPDLLVILDLPHEKLEARWHGRRKTLEIYEQADLIYLKRMRERYLACSWWWPEKTLVLDADMPTPSQVEKILERLKEMP